MSDTIQVTSAILRGLEDSIAALHGEMAATGSDIARRIRRLEERGSASRGVTRGRAPKPEQGGERA